MRSLVFNPTDYSSWIRNSALTPTPIQLREGEIRVYCGFRDDEGVSRIGYVDVDAKAPTKVIRVSSKPALDIGADGCFDDNGVILGDLQQKNDELWLYYVGFQLVKKAKFLAFTGLAISRDGGESFKRFSHTPILDRCHGGTTIRAIHSLKRKGAGWEAWFAQGDSWETINQKKYPRYNIWQAYSKDGIHFDNAKLIVDNSEELQEYRIGRPSFSMIGEKEVLFFTSGSRSGEDYFPSMAVRDIRGDWVRDNTLFPLHLSKEGWDSKHLCYPRLIEVEGKHWIFYNGNNMGFEGFGVAEVSEWVKSKF